MLQHYRLGLWDLGDDAAALQAGHRVRWLCAGGGGGGGPWDGREAAAASTGHQPGVPVALG